jgi:hypothetical protein
MKQNLQVTKPRARPFYADQNRTVFWYWLVSGNGHSVTGFELDRAVKFWYSAELESQTRRRVEQ